MMSTTDRLAYMANQIARNLEVQGHSFAVAATADHIRSFWDPRMKTQIFDILDRGKPELTPIAREAVRLLHDAVPLPHQTGATQFNHADEVGHSDAG